MEAHRVQDRLSEKGRSLPSSNWHPPWEVEPCPEQVSPYLGQVTVYTWHGGVPPAPYPGEVRLGEQCCLWGCLLDKERETEPMVLMGYVRLTEYCGNEVGGNSLDTRKTWNSWNSVVLQAKRHRYYLLDWLLACLYACQLSSLIWNIFPYVTHASIGNDVWYLWYVWQTNDCPRPGDVPCKRFDKEYPAKLNTCF